MESDIVVVDYRLEKKNTMQIYDRNNGALLYSCTVNPEVTTGVAGFPYEINGKQYGITPMGVTAGGSFFFIITPDQFGEDEGNPAILRLRPRH